ncbi:MerR family transcriptional regulator [Sinobaca sp. H24]|uniref:MerR family transcriptional regulator n=1 Tax=Sinobaca sp. H24 TaxID=2923376 RepID=UPI00207A81CB|nr:MerR family transcriptional regulator [Sinobaca sp. H24]
MKGHIPRHTACFPISVVQELTHLSARQIRYYEEQGLISPERNQGNQRLFSLADIDRCSDIKELIDQGLNIAGIRTVLAAKKTSKEKKMNVPKRSIPKENLDKLQPHLKKLDELEN